MPWASAESHMTWTADHGKQVETGFSSPQLLHGDSLQAGCVPTESHHSFPYIIFPVRANVPSLAHLAKGGKTLCPRVLDPHHWVSSVERIILLTTFNLYACVIFLAWWAQAVSVITEVTGNSNSMRVRRKLVSQVLKPSAGQCLYIYVKMKLSHIFVFHLWSPLKPKFLPDLCVFNCVCVCVWISSICAISGKLKALKNEKINEPNRNELK